MKKKLLSLAIIAFVYVQAIAQAPQKFNYQGIARSATGAALAGQALGLKISILQSSSSGTNLYTETHSTTTNTMGLFNVAIGTGTVTSGSFSGIMWSDGDKYIKVEMDPAGGSTFVLLGTTQLLSTPYTLRAEDAGMVTIFGNGSQNANKMVIKHSPAYPNWGLQYNDTLDQFRFLRNGTNILEIDLGVSQVKVDGALKITSGNPGINKVLTSDATGNATWQAGGTAVSAFQPLGCQALAAPTTTYQKIGDMGTFTKNSAGTMIELNVQTNIYVQAFGSGASAVFELRVDDVATTIGNATALLREASFSKPVTFIGIFTGLTSGIHTVSLWVKEVNGSATNAVYDAGCFNSIGTNNVLVKEFN